VSPQSEASTALSRSPWYRYLFCGWLFRDVSVGSLLERAAAWRHNREQARWLTTYMRRWCALGVLFYLFGALFELLAASPAVSAFFFVPSAISVTVNAVLGAAWIGFKTLPPPI
jgi:polyferredoxin